MSSCNHWCQCLRCRFSSAEWFLVYWHHGRVHPPSALLLVGINTTLWKWRQNHTLVGLVWNYCHSFWCSAWEFVTNMSYRPRFPAEFKGKRKKTLWHASAAQRMECKWTQGGVSEASKTSQGNERERERKGEVVTMSSLPLHTKRWWNIDDF